MVYIFNIMVAGLKTMVKERGVDDDFRHQVAKPPNLKTNHNWRIYAMIFVHFSATF